MSKRLCMELGGWCFPAARFSRCPPALRPIALSSLTTTVRHKTTVQPSGRQGGGAGTSTIDTVLTRAVAHDYSGAVSEFERVFRPAKQNLFTDLCCAAPHLARDFVQCLMRCYASLGRMGDVRTVFVVGLRDLPGRYINASFFDCYLEVLTRRKNFADDELQFVIEVMKETENVRPSPLTYLYITELCVCMGKDPAGAWREMKEWCTRAPPLTAMIQLLLSGATQTSSDPLFVVEVLKCALRYDDGVSAVGDVRGIDRKLISEMAIRWLDNPDYAAEHVLWLLCELELRCVYERASFVQLVQKQHLAQLLLKCAKNGDGVSGSRVLAMMDRHAVSRSADVLALVVWCWASSGDVGRALDAVEVMARKGYLEHVDPFRRYIVDCVRYTMERNFLMILADSMLNSEMVGAALSHLRERVRKGRAVTAHSLDVLVLASSKLGDAKKAVQLVESYQRDFGVAPRTSTYNCLLLACGALQGTTLQRAVYETMIRDGINPNAFTFRVLIRQAVLADDIDEAVEYLRQVPQQHPPLRVEVEMILPILERAARVGDVETANRVSKYSLDCDIGIDAAIIGNVMQNLRDAGQDVSVLADHLPLHEALRSRSKAARQRARHDLVV